MTHYLSNEDEQHLKSTIQQSLQMIAEQMGHPINQEKAEQLYQEAIGLLSYLAYAPITLARVAGTLLVYRTQNVEPEEVAWFKTQVEQCSNDEEVEELIESIHRTDAL